MTSLTGTPKTNVNNGEVREGEGEGEGESEGVAAMIRFKIMVYQG